MDFYTIGGVVALALVIAFVLVRLSPPEGASHEPGRRGGPSIGTGGPE